MTFYAGWRLLGVQGLAPEQHIGSAQLFDLVKLSFGVVAGAGALVALVNGYRRQRVDEARHRVDEAAALREETRLHTERFTAAIAQLGEPAEAVRLGAVHALAGLADDAPTSGLRQTCIDVLCSFLRLPFTAEADGPDDDASARNAYLALREVRHTVIRLIRDHLRLLPEHPHSWQGFHFDFTSVAFDGGDFSGAKFSGARVDFKDTIFSGARVDFRRSSFCDGEVTFHGAMFSDCEVDFRGATFKGAKVDFSSTTFDASVSFRDATFSDGSVTFDGAMFLGSHVDFCSSFSGGSVSLGAEFSGDTVSFRGASFAGSEVSFDSTNFSGSTATFRGANFSGGTVHYDGTRFSEGKVTFRGAAFSGADITFHDAKFSGGKVDLSAAVGQPPSGLVPAHGENLPDGLILPPEWYPTKP
ncbi:pentapeptide repeat-containing protein [Streptomyces sp. NPDC093225]|uniref:pentapeptide repeat-containing protein n=1 Tax=Streptomyces sp. NPDC093225 TaxID=3366034 RepID=UPI0038148E6F